MKPEKDCDSPSTPITSRSAFLQHRKRSSPHPISFLHQPGIAKELWELHYDEEEHEKSSSTSKTPNTSQAISDDSGFDVSQENAESKDEHSYTLRKRYKHPFN